MPVKKNNEIPENYNRIFREFSGYNGSPDMLAKFGDGLEHLSAAAFLVSNTLSIVDSLQKTTFISPAISGFDFIDSAAIFVLSICALKAAKNATRYNGVLTGLATLNLFNSFQLMTAAVSGIVLMCVLPNPLLLSSIAAASFATAAIISATQEMAQLIGAIKKLSIGNLLDDRIQRVKNLDARISKLEENNAGHKNDQKIEALINKKQSIDAQLESIARVHYQQKGNMTAKWKKHYGEAKPAQSTAVDQRVVDYLNEKHKAEVWKRLGSFMWWGLATLAGVLVISSFFYPPLTIVAATVALVVAGLKIMQALSIPQQAYSLVFHRKLDLTVDTYLVNHYVRHREGQAICKNQDIDKIPTKHNNSDISTATRQKIALAYEMAKRDGNSTITAEAFTENLMKKNWFERNKVLNGALKQKIDQEGLQKNSILKDMSVQNRREFSKRISKSEQKQLANEGLRSQYRFFQKKTDGAPTSSSRAAFSKA